MQLFKSSFFAVHNMRFITYWIFSTRHRIIFPSALPQLRYSFHPKSIIKYQQSYRQKLLSSSALIRN